MCTYRLDEICVKELQSLEIVEIYWTHFARFSQNLLILHEMQQESESMCAKLTARIGAWYEWQGWLFHVYRLLITFVYSDEGMSWNIECCFSLLFKTRLFKKKKIYSGIFFSVHNLCTQQQWAWNEAIKMWPAIIQEVWIMGYLFGKYRHFPLIFTISKDSRGQMSGDSLPFPK